MLRWKTSNGLHTPTLPELALPISLTGRLGRRKDSPKIPHLEVGRVHYSRPDEADAIAAASSF